MVRISFLTCVFLIGLRLVIGWHFLFEGLNKVRSVNTGPAEISKPFSSEGYFLEAEGPLGPEMREIIGDPDEAALAKLKLSDGKMPVVLEKNWHDYTRQFEDFYRLDDQEKEQAAAKLEAAEKEYLSWLNDERPHRDDGAKKEKDESKKSKKTVISSEGPVSYEVEEKVQHRILAYKNKIEEIRDVYKLRLPSFGKDVEKAHLRTLKAEAASMRADLMADVDEHTKKFKESLAKIVAPKLAGFDAGDPKDPKIDDNVLEMVTLTGEPAKSDGEDKLTALMPEKLAVQWDEYAKYARKFGHEDLHKNTENADEILRDAKIQYVRFLLDRNQYVANTPLPEPVVGFRREAYRKALVNYREAQEKQKKDNSDKNKDAVASAQKQVQQYRQDFIDDIKKHTEALKLSLGGFATGKEFDNFKGTIEPAKPVNHVFGNDWPVTKLEWLDWSTRWGLFIAGGCVLFGLFTRLACLGCVAFLAVEILSNTPLPWLPVSPKNEGNYFFVNKNVVELMALLVLATLPTGRWLGLDALLSRIWPFRKKKNQTVR